MKHGNTKISQTSLPLEMNVQRVEVADSPRRKLVRTPYEKSNSYRIAWNFRLYLVIILIIIKASFSLVFYPASTSHFY